MDQVFTGTNAVATNEHDVEVQKDKTKVLDLVIDQAKKSRFATNANDVELAKAQLQHEEAMEKLRLA